MTSRDLASYSMTPAERCRASILVVESDSVERAMVRSSLRSLGFVTIVECQNHAAALERLSTQRFSHVIFEADTDQIAPDDFVKRVVKLCGDDTVIIATSLEPLADDVVNLLTKGARGYLRKPFSVELLEESVELATKGDPIHEAVLNAADRNEALLSVVIAAVDRAAGIAKQATRYQTASRELVGAMLAVRRSVHLAKSFAKGGEEGYLSAAEKFFIECSQGPASRLGKIRHKLSRNRGTVTK